MARAFFSAGEMFFSQMKVLFNLFLPIVTRSHPLKLYILKVNNGKSEKDFFYYKTYYLILSNAKKPVKNYGS